MSTPIDVRAIAVSDDAVAAALHSVGLSPDSYGAPRYRRALEAAARFVVADELQRIAVHFMPDSASVRPEDTGNFEDAMEIAEAEGARSMCGCLMFLASRMREDVSGGLC